MTITSSELSESDKNAEDFLHLTFERLHWREWNMVVGLGSLVARLEVGLLKNVAALERLDTTPRMLSARIVPW